MYAVLRLNSFDPDKLAVSGQGLEQFDEVHAAQAGYVGSVVVDIGGGRHFALYLWESAEHSAAALLVLGPEIGRLLGPFMAKQSELIGAGTVISSDRAPSRDQGNLVRCPAASDLRPSRGPRQSR